MRNMNGRIRHHGGSVHFWTERRYGGLLTHGHSGIDAAAPGAMQMDELDEQTRANMDVALEEICREMKHGGDHESRKFIAERLMQCAREGRTSLADLNSVARRALLELVNRKSA